MSFFAIFFALLIEQARPLGRGNPLHGLLRNWVQWVARNLDAGKPQHGWLTWGVAVVLPAAVTLAVHWALVETLGWALAVAWNIAVLYVCVGFRQFSHHFTSIRDALNGGDEARARQLLAEWLRVDASELPRSEIVRHVIETSVLAAHRHVFGVLAWQTVLAAFGFGPAGAVFYRMSEYVSRYWREQPLSLAPSASPALQQVASEAWHVIDWLPARITALSFAVVGSFEDAVDGWRHHAQQFPDDNDGVILAATAGAVNVRLGGAALKPELPGDVDAEGLGQPTPGRVAELSHLSSVVGLVWRSVVTWMVLLALLTLARLLG